MGVPSVDHVEELVVVILTDVGVMLTVSTMEIAVVISMMSVDLVMETVVDTVVPDVGAMMFVLPMEIAVLIMTSYAPLKLPKLEELDKKSLSNKTKDLVTTIEVPTTMMDLVLDPVVVMLMAAGVIPSASGTEIAVVISMMSVDLVMEIVVDTVVPDVGAMMFVLPMEIAVLIITCYAPLIKKECQK